MCQLALDMFGQTLNERILRIHFAMRTMLVCFIRNVPNVKRIRICR